MPLRTSGVGVLGAMVVAGLAVGELRPPQPTVTAQVRLANAPASRSPRPDSLAHVTFRVEGMTCGGCTIATRTVLTRLPGVVRAEVTYEPQQAVVTYDPAKVTVAWMIAAIRTLNYTATVIPSRQVAPARAAPSSNPAPATTKT
jgi:copper chaperone CopZ